MTKRKKTMLIVVITVIALIPILLILNSIDFTALYRKIKNDDEPEETRDIEFYEPKFGYDIFKDPDYTSIDKTIFFKVGAETFGIDETNTGNPGQKLFVDYFDAVINGKHEKYNSLFTNDYIKKHGKKDRFTMQRIYNAMVEAFPAERLNDNVVVHRYTVMYCIMKNDGTFRRDVGSDENIPLIFEVYEYTNGDVKINEITKIKYR